MSNRVFWKPTVLINENVARRLSIIERIGSVTLFFDPGSGNVFRRAHGEWKTSREPVVKLAAGRLSETAGELSPETTRIRADDEAIVTTWSARVPTHRTARLTFEDAMGHLRAGNAVRRAGWKPDVFLFRLKEDVFIKAPNAAARAPSEWKPYPEDFLMTDWLVCGRRDA